jgi:four helix bundle protein
MDNGQFTTYFFPPVRKTLSRVVLLEEASYSNTHSEIFALAKGDDIQDRLVKFAVAVMHLCDELPKSATTSPIAGQLARSAAGASANYAEARGAESRSDFIHKLGITYKELNESENWLRLLLEGKVLPEQRIRSVYEDCSILCRIIAASRRTARERSQANSH